MHENCHTEVKMKNMEQAGKYSVVESITNANLIKLHTIPLVKLAVFMFPLHPSWSLAMSLLRKDYDDSIIKSG